MSKQLEYFNAVTIEKRPTSIYNAQTNEKIASFESLKNCANHLGVSCAYVSTYIKDGIRFGVRRRKNRKYKYDFPILIKYGK